MPPPPAMSGKAAKVTRTPSREQPFLAAFTGTGRSGHAVRRQRSIGAFSGARRYDTVQSIDTVDRDHYHEQTEDRFFQHGKDHEGSGTIHRFTHAERERMRMFNSIEYWTPASQMQKQHHAEDPSDEPSAWQQGIVYAAIGLCVGCVACVLLNSLEALHEVRLESLKHGLEPIKEHDTQGRWKSFVPWYFIGLAFVAASTFLCWMWPAAAGSGVPEVMAYLNGVVMVNVFSLKTLFCKVVSCMFSVSGGLPVGPEGPMIHIGALVGAGVGSGRSDILRCSTHRGAEKRDNPRELREFITAGAACGVACAFSAPIGGLLFVMEEVSSFFSKDALWMAFFSCLIAIFTFNSLATNINGWTARDTAGGACTTWAEWISSDTILFKVNVLKNVNMIAVIPCIFVGAVCGILASAFTIANIKIVRWRAKHVNPKPWQKMVEPCVVYTLFCLVSYSIVMAMPCETKLEHRHNDSTFFLNYGRSEGQLELFDSVCDNPEEQYHPLGSLVFASPDDTVRLLMRRDPLYTAHDEQEGRVKPAVEQQPLVGARLFPYGTLFLYLGLYCVFSCWSAGMFIASGIVIPMLTMGSTIGRIMGLAVVDLIRNGFGVTCDGVAEWIDPGTFALIGAASFFSGVSRLTFSLCVIMIEISGDLQQLPPIMVGVMVAKVIADSFTHSLYHALLEVKCVPFLDYGCDHPYIDLYSAGHLMSKVTDVTMFKIKGDKVLKVIRILEKTDHNGFPVVGIQIRPGRFKGLVLRKQLQYMLHFFDERRQALCRQWAESRGLDPNIPAEDILKQLSDAERVSIAKETVAMLHEWSYEELEDMREEMYWGRYDAAILPHWEIDDPILLQPIDLTHIVNTSAFSVPKNFCVTSTYQLFRSMGLRHLVITNAANQVAGIITRKDLISQNIEERTVSRVILPNVSKEMMFDAIDDFILEIPDAACRGHTVLLVSRMPTSEHWGHVVDSHPPLIAPNMYLIGINHEMVSSKSDLARAVSRAPGEFDVEFVPHCNVDLTTKTEVKRAIDRMGQMHNAHTHRRTRTMQDGGPGSLQHGRAPSEPPQRPTSEAPMPVLRSGSRTALSLPTNDFEDDQEEYLSPTNDELADLGGQLGVTAPVRSVFDGRTPESAMPRQYQQGRMASSPPPMPRLGEVPSDDTIAMCPEAGQTAPQDPKPMASVRSGPHSTPMDPLWTQNDSQIPPVPMRTHQQAFGPEATSVHPDSGQQPRSILRTGSHGTKPPAEVQGLLGQLSQLDSPRLGQFFASLATHQAGDGEGGDVALTRLRKHLAQATAARRGSRTTMLTAT